jgi:hypothetical protein
MKNKPNPTILKTSFLSTEIVKRTPKSHETIPLTDVQKANVLKRKIAGSTD